MSSVLSFVSAKAANAAKARKTVLRTSESRCQLPLECLLKRLSYRGAALVTRHCMQHYAAHSPLHSNALDKT